MGCNTCPKSDPNVDRDSNANRSLLITSPAHGVRQTTRHPVASLGDTLEHTDKTYNPEILEDGSILYEESDLPKPPEIDGYTRDPDHPWLFHCEWSPCDWRLFGLRTHKLGMLNVIAICQHPESEVAGKYVKHQTCQGCPLRPQ